METTAVTLPFSRSMPSIFSIKTLGFLMGLGMLVSISAGYIVWAFVLLTLLVSIFWKKQAVAWKELPSWRLCALYVFWGLVASLAGVDPARSLYLWRSDFLCIVLWSLYLLFLFYPESQRPALRGFWIGIVLMSILGIFQFVNIYYFPGVNESMINSGVSLIRRLAVHPHHHLRVHGHLHILTYAEILVMAGLFALGQPWRRAWHKVALSMLCLAAILASQSRGAFVAFVAGTAFFFGVSFWWHRKLAWKVLIPLFFIGAVALSLPFVSKRVIGTFGMKDNRDRIVMWRVGARMVKDHPVTGVGIGHVKTLWNQYCRQEWRAYLTDSREVWSDVHSLYFQQASERGIPGLLLVVSLLASFPLMLIRKMRQLPHPTVQPGGEFHRRREYLLAACSASIAFLIMNLTESAFQDTEVIFVLYFILAAVFASEKRFEITAP